jgi:hypothetical protein
MFWSYLDSNQGVAACNGETSEVLRFCDFPLAYYQYAWLWVARGLSPRWTALAFSSGPTHNALFVQWNEVTQYRNRSVPALEITPLQVFTLARLDLRQWIHNRRPLLVFFCQPYLISM